MTEREAKRMRDEIMRGVNRQVMEVPSRISFADFVRIYEQRHMSTLTYTFSIQWPRQGTADRKQRCDT